MSDEQKRIGVTVPLEIYQAFRSKCFWNLRTMQEILLEQIQEYVNRKEGEDGKDVG